MMDNIEPIQLLNTAIIKSKEKKIDCEYDERLGQLCQTPAIEALHKAITHLSESQKISKDQAAVLLINTVRELDSIWSDYVMMEGIDRLKGMLKGQDGESGLKN